MAGIKCVNAGGLAIGGGNPVSVQSMTNTRTADTGKTSSQINALAAAGCELVRFAIKDEADARAVKTLKANTSVPLCADIHFDYRLAILCVENGIDKLRINPGNIGDELRVKQVADCVRAHGIPVRVGVNGGSLEKELLLKYGGPTSDALAESAMGHVRILEKYGINDIVISAKSSNVNTTVNAYRRIRELCDYPLHVGVTEAGGGELAVIKSATGIGSLLLDGIGDTIRVSLTGDPVREVYAGMEILKAVGLRNDGIEVISCPTCGRCQNIDAHFRLAKRVEEEFGNVKTHLKVAVMGCAVNGPGEAKEADIGIAYGRDNAVVFKNGELDISGKLPDIEEQFIVMIKDMLS